MRRKIMSSVDERYDSIPHFLKRELNLPIYFDQLSNDWQALLSLVHTDTELLLEVRKRVASVLDDIEYLARDTESIYVDLLNETVTE